MDNIARQASTGRLHGAPEDGKAGLRQHIGPLLLLFALSLALFLPGLSSLPLTDRDEALFVQASRQMVETGNWLDIRFQEEPRYKKPIGIYWLQGLSASAFGGGAKAPLVFYRLPSLIGAILTVFFTYGIGACLSSRKAGLIAGTLAAATVELAFEARIGKTDAMLCACVAAGQFALAWALVDDRQRPVFARTALFWLALGLGTLIKGPVAPMIAVFTLAGLCWQERSTRLLRALAPHWGLPLYLLAVLPWLVAIGFISDGAFFRDSVGRDMLAKIATGQESHGAPPGTYLLVANLSFWPLSAFLPLALVFAYRKRRARAVQMLLFWVLPFWLVCELVATKLPNYVLPVMPALAVLSGLALSEDGLRANRIWFRLCYASPAMGATIIGLGLNGLVYWSEGIVDRQTAILAVILAGAGVAASVFLMRNRLLPGLVALGITGILAYGLGFALALPRAQGLFLSDRIAEAAAHLKTCPSPQIVTVGYGEPSLVFRLGTDIKRVGAEDGAEIFRASPCALAAVESRDVAVFRAALGPDAPVPVGSVGGRNLNGLRYRDMQIFTKP